MTRHSNSDDAQRILRENSVFWCLAKLTNYLPTSTYSSNKIHLLADYDAV